MKFPTFLQTLLTDYFRWVVIGVMVIIFGLGYFLVLDQKIANLRTSGILERANVEAELESQQAYLDKLEESIDTFRTVVPETSLNEIDTFVPTGTDFPGLIVALEALAQSSNLALESVTVNDVGQTVAAVDPGSDAQAGAGTPALAATPSGVNLRTQDATIAVAGGTSYESFKRFLTLVESSRRLMDVVSVGFSFPLPDTPEVAPAPYTVVVRTYYLPASTQ